MLASLMGPQLGMSLVSLDDGVVGGWLGGWGDLRLRDDFDAVALDSSVGA